MSVEIAIGCVVAALVIGVLSARRCEIRAYNRGCCRRCGSRWRRFDTDSSGARGYTCDTCGAGCWVSYDIEEDTRR